MRFDVIGLGEILIDLAPLGKSENGSPRYEANPGGAPPNALTAVVRQGGKAAFIGKVGRDYFGNFLVDAIRKVGIHTEGILFDEKHPTTLAIVSLDAEGDRSFGFYRNHSADVMLTADEVDTKLIRQSSLFHFGSLSLTDEPARSATFHVLASAREHNLYISYDPNLRMPLWDNAEHARENLLSGLPFADILKIGKDEFEFLFGTADYESLASEIMETYDITYLFITDGPQGAYFRHNGYSGKLPTYDVPVVDTTGAGDAFTGTVIYHLSKLDKDEFYQLSEARLQEIVRRANASGALSTTKYGGIPSIPTAEEIDECIKHRPIL